MKITIRGANPDTDYERIAEIINTFDRQPITAEELTRWDSLTKPGGTRRRLVATTDGQIVAYCGLVHDAWVPDGLFMLGLVVDPSARNQGVGSQFYDEAVRIARSHGAQSFSVEVLDNDPVSQHFAEQRGFALDHHVFESTLDLHTFDPSQFAAQTEQVEAQGIRIFSLQDAPFTRENLHKLWQVNHDTALDDPAAIGKFPSFEEFEEIITTGEWFRPDGQILAADGDTYVGLSAVGYFKESNSAYNMMTGVSRSHRGKGIAQALKLRSIQVAKSWGVDYIRTNNDSQNGPMLKINHKLGYVPQPGIYRMNKVLEG